MLLLWGVLQALPWRLLGVGALVGAVFAGGCQFGEKRVSAEWDAEKVATAQAVAKQAIQVAIVTTQQTTINQEISNEFQKAKAAITADRRHLLARVPERVRLVAPDGDGSVPSVSSVTARVAEDAADAVPAAEQPVNTAACEKLAEDAAQTTLMVVEFQRWYRAQAEANSSPPN